jgi:hypothetical protein
MLVEDADSMPLVAVGMAYLLGQPAITHPVDRYAIPTQPACKKHHISIAILISNIYLRITI